MTEEPRVPTSVTQGEIDRLRELLAKAAPLPWAYRPQEHDDWGMIRTTVANEDGWHPIVAVSRGDQEHGLHRAAGTDPFEPNGALIVAAINSLPALLASSSTPAFDERERLREALEQIAEHDDECTPDHEIEARIAWIDAELADEPNRSPYGDDEDPPCRNGYEVTELVAERAGLIARSALASIRSGDAG